MTKEQLINEVIRDIQEDPTNYAEFVADLIHEALNTRTKKELMEILHGEE